MTGAPFDGEGTTRAFHQRTKHHVHRYAAALGFMDWDSQPDPFRRYVGAPLLDLPLAADERSPTFAEIHTGAAPPARMELPSIALLFELSLGLSAWKEHGAARWALRCNPSSGNLHPTEGYLISPALPGGLDAGVFHYQSHDHRLEQRCRLSGAPAGELADMLGIGVVLVGLSSIHWRESWKYGERAFRYCQHDVGHAIAAVAYAARVLGWKARVLDAPGDDRVAAVLGLDRDEDFAALDPLDREHPDLLIAVGPGDGFALALAGLPGLVARGAWAGVPNALSSAHHRWEVIEEVAHAARKEDSEREVKPRLWPMPALGETSPATAAAVIRTRRSAMAMDGQSGIRRADFFQVLDATMPRRDAPPFDAWPSPARIHLAIFAHRVEDLPCGLYLLARGDEAMTALKSATRAEFCWTRAPQCPEHLPLFLLQEGDWRRTAAAICCGQDIAGDGAFSLAMIAMFDRALAEGAFWYRRLFWEAGVIGQSLYLQAEARGLRGTGIGCYFDDEMHRVLGLADDRFQSLYHFTVGGAVEDARLRTRPPYAHLKPR